MATTSARYTDAYVQANGLNFHYVEWGDPAAPTIVCLHGLRGHGHTWDAFAEGMVDDYHLICIDQRGDASVTGPLMGTIPRSAWLPMYVGLPTIWG